MAPMETYLKNISAYGVLELEFMWTVEQAQIILNAWGTVGIQKELFVSYVDYGYMVGYSLFLGMAQLLLLRACDRKAILSKNQKSLLIWGTIFPFLAAGFDVVENINLIVILLNPTSLQAINTFLASLCASIKFGLLFLGFGSILFTLILLLVKKKQI
jgi:hypothetical protein